MQGRVLIHVLRESLHGRVDFPPFFFSFQVDFVLLFLFFLFNFFLTLFFLGTLSSIFISFFCLLFFLETHPYLSFFLFLYLFILRIPFFWKYIQKLIYPHIYHFLFYLFIYFSMNSVFFFNQLENIFYFFIFPNILFFFLNRENKQKKRVKKQPKQGFDINDRNKASNYLLKCPKSRLVVSLMKSLPQVVNGTTKEKMRTTLFP